MRTEQERRPEPPDAREVEPTGAGRGPAVPARLQLPWLVRDRDQAVVAGVAAAVGGRLVVDPMLVRLAFLVLSFAGGAGVVLYLGLWALTPERSADPRARPPGDLERTPQRALAVGAITLGLLFGCREVGLWLGDAIVWPVFLGAVGSALLWARSDEDERARLTGLAARVPGAPFATALSGQVSWWRVAVGALLVASGMATFLAATDSFAALGNLLLALGVAVVGLGLILGPWLWRLGRQLTEERRERIRSEERAEVAAHLHDSVLQTLALIQRADAPPEVRSLARAQERELRNWLYDGGPRPANSLKTAMEEAAVRVEQHHRVPVDAVVVGDAALDGGLPALVQACAEAMTNAAIHAAADQVSVYVEVEADRATAYVRDEGRGFDPAGVAADRQGIAESIRGRLERHGGTATLLTTPGEGTEWELVMPRRPAP